MYFDHARKCYDVIFSEHRVFSSVERIHHFLGDAKVGRSFIGYALFFIDAAPCSCSLALQLSIKHCRCRLNAVAPMDMLKLMSEDKPKVVDPVEAHGQRNDWRDFI